MAKIMKNTIYECFIWSLRNRSNKNKKSPSRIQKIILPGKKCAKHQTLHLIKKKKKNTNSHTALVKQI